MPKKKSVKKAAERFRDAADYVVTFATNVSHGVGDRQASWVHDHAVIRLYREFEQLMLEALVGTINNDTATISTKSGFDFPKHLTDEVCEYLITGGGYFDFRGRSGLIREIKQYVPENHYLLNIVKKQTYEASIDQLVALRNFAAHGSSVSKKAALRATGQQKMRSAGAWLKISGRLGELVDNLKLLADEVESQAPY